MVVKCCKLYSSFDVRQAVAIFIDDIGEMRICAQNTFTRTRRIFTNIEERDCV